MACIIYCSKRYFLTFNKNKYWHFRGFYAFRFLSQGTKVTCEIFKTEMISSPGKCPIIL